MKKVQTPSSPVREREREKERMREREKERMRERERKREKGRMGAFAPFSYLVGNIKH